MMKYNIKDIRLFNKGNLKQLNSLPDNKQGEWRINMLISMNWISEFTDLNGVDIKELINRFTLSTAEVEDVYEMGKNIKDVVVGKIIEISDHPNSRSFILSRWILARSGGGGMRAPNIFVGALVPFAAGSRVGDLR